MKNKKGVSIGRIILYFLFLTLVVFFVWTLYLTFKSMKKEKISTDSQINSSLRMVDNNSNVVYNLYDNSSYPFVYQPLNNGYTTNIAVTGGFIPCNPGTYSVSFDSSLFNYFKIAVNANYNPGFIYTSDNQFYDSHYLNTNSLTFTINQFGYVGFWVTKLDDSFNIDLNLLNSFEIMVNEGQLHSYVPYDTNFDNATNYINNVYFSGFLHNISGTSPNGISYNSFDVRDYLPFTNTPYSTNKAIYRSNKTYYNLTTYYSSDLYVGYSYNTLFSSLYNNTYSAEWWSDSNTSRLITGLSYNSSLTQVVAYYTTSNPIPVSLFNFIIYDSIQPGARFGFHINGNDNISIDSYVDSSTHISYDFFVNLNPNLRYINSFSITYYVGSISIGRYASSSSIHILFDNFYGNDQWILGYQTGYAAGVANADSALATQNVELQNAIADLTSDNLNLNSRVNQQSDIINQLNNELQQSQNNFKGLFFTFADIPFRTVSNALGFEFWGINLFRFFVGIITALGIVWLIKKIIQECVYMFFKKVLISFFIFFSVLMLFIMIIRLGNNQSSFLGLSDLLNYFDIGKIDFYKPLNYFNNDIGGIIRDFQRYLVEIQINNPLDALVAIGEGFVQLFKLISIPVVAIFDFLKMIVGYITIFADFINWIISFEGYPAIVY